MRRKLVIMVALVAVMAACVCSAAFGGEAGRVEGEVNVTIKLAGISGREPTIEEIRDAAERAAKRAGAYVATVYDAISKASCMACVVIKSDTLTTDELIDRLVVQPDVLSATPNYTFTLDSREPDDPGYLNDKAWGMKAIKANVAWERTVGDENIYVAIIDSGINLAHEDLKDNIAEQTYWENYVDDGGKDLPKANDQVNDTLGHGSHVAGIIGAMGNNGLGVVGVNWRVKMIPYRVFGATGGGSYNAVINSLNGVLKLLRGTNAPKIAAINMSLGGWEDQSPNRFLRFDDRGKAIRAINELPNAPLIATCAGNEGLEHTSNGKDYYYPAAVSQIPEITNVISVAGTASDGGAYPNTNWSSEYVDVAAPGTGIYSTINGSAQAYDYMQGTSMAAPHVAGAAALLAARLEREGRPWNGAMLKEVLTKTANASINPTSDNSNGEQISKYGLIDLAAAMAYLDIAITNITISVTPDTAATSLQAGSEATLTANITPPDATVKKVSWSITEGDANVEIINSSDTTATIRGKANGSAKIRATAGDGSDVYGEIMITVTGSQHVHIPDGIWHSDDDNHWHECTDGDGAVLDIAAHSGGTWDTSEAGVHKKTCEICQAPYARDSHSAKSQSWEHDGSTHWHICGDCGVKIDEAGHDDNGQLKDDDPNEHWRLCSVCGEPRTKSPHDWDTTLVYNDIKHMKRCLTCKYQQTPGDDHVWSPSFENDGDDHWHRCSTQGCGAESTREPHRDQKADGRCDDCGAPVTHIHNVSTWKHDTSGHWKECTGCGNRYDEGTHSLEMFAADDAHWRGCSVCGYEETRAPHTYSGWGHSAFDHWQECSVCRKAGAMSVHTFGTNGACTVCAYVDPNKVPSSYPTPPGHSNKVIEGMNVVWRLGSGNIRIVIDIPWTFFLGITLDGRALVAGSDYILDHQGSSPLSSKAALPAEPTRIYLTEKLLETLSIGEHTVKCSFASEPDVDVRFTIAAATDDAKGGSGGGCATGAAAVIAVTTLAVIKRRKK